MGVMNGDAGLVPLEAVMLGVANAGDAMTTAAVTSTSATKRALLIDFIVSVDPFTRMF